MPLFEFKCDVCEHVSEFYFTSYKLAPRHSRVPCTSCGHGLSSRQTSAPGSVQVTGFSSLNGYSSPRSISQRHGSIKTTVSGNFEAFSDGLHK